MIAAENVVIVGGGLAGATAAFEVRKRGHDGPVIVVAEEELPPYERPPLSKTYLRGESPITDAYVRPTADYEANEIELLLGRRAVTVDPFARVLNLADGATLPYGALLLATGAAPRPLRVPGDDLRGVQYLRTAGDADRIRQAAADARRTVVVGGGWIGSEVAASLCQLGHEVALVSNLARPLERVLGPEVASVYAGLHAEHGVQLRSGHVVELEGETSVEAVRLAGGMRLPADLVVVGVGAAPRIRLALRAGLETIEGAVAVDEHLRTSVPSIYAAGDVAAAWHPRYARHLRVEHWDNAIRQGKAAAANMLGEQEVYDRAPYFYSDQFDLGMEYSGLAGGWDQVVVRGDLAARAFDAFWLADGRVVAAMNANRWDDGTALRRLVNAHTRIDPQRLADIDIPLDEAVLAAA
jgi:3-phenylpropionate/trans-cinnamate dioxygenase ferredoxin reductase component